MARFTPDFFLSTFNSAFATQLKLDSLEIIGQPITALIPVEANLWQMLIEEGKPFHVEKCKIVQKDQPEPLYWELTAWPLKSKEVIKGGIILALDVTERNKLQQQREDFIAAIAHDIKNPLVGADRILSLLTTSKLDKDEHDRVISLLKQSNSDVLAMLHNLLDVYKYETLAISLNLQPLEISIPMQAAVSNCAANAKEKELIVDLKVSRDLPKVLADDSALQRLFSNLLHNAFRFARPNTVVRFTASRDDLEIKIEVEDEGLGMTEDEQRSLFKRFGESRKSKYTAGAGTGLGLYLCKKIADAHKSSIACSSQVGIGTKFTIKIPIIEDSKNY
jgi:signal transduction histidine kinase